ncbi:activating signal cointegrator 1 complex subunit 2 isoform X1 [Brachionus plicatilis]|uniref:Activating signal cointegrator 1 complex subunit 2 isoform X1 n=1 Tax=Brachionus plicatilis TaxID=10195 RepID=A0A3M7R9Y5_BRAPC|nr:activating signal cointegrator 1 complex subunit 2 isoform X1 [Brachionus plicatilis]
MSDQILTEPLDQQVRLIFNKTTQKEEKIPALNRIFKVERQIIPYLAPPLSILEPKSVDFRACLEQYEERLGFIEQDLKWLLSLPHQKFWCQIIYDTSCQNMIDSYLKLAPRPYDTNKIDFPMQIANLHNSIHRLVFLVCLRMSTYKENRENFINQNVFADLIYKNYLFDIPKILDLCILYEKNPVLNKIIQNLFSVQKNYYDDFKISIKDIIKAIETSRKSLHSIFELESKYDIGATKSLEFVAEKLPKNMKEILDIIYYLTDFARTLSNLISIQTNLAQYLFDQKFELNIKNFFETTLFEIEEIINKLRKKHSFNSENIGFIKIKLSGLKYEMTKLFSLIFEHSLVKPIIESLDSFSSSDQIQQLTDSFVKICCDILEDKHFLCYFEEKFNFSEQIDLIFQLSQERIDQSQYEYIIENLRSSILEFSRSKKSKAKFQNIAPKPDLSEVEIQPTCSKNLATEDDFAKSVLDLLPDLAPDLVKKCLNYFNNNVEQVINAFLENNLPQFPSKEPENLISNQSEQNLRKNIYDNDEFDVFNKNEVDLSKIYLGKKNEIEKFDLDNKDDVCRDFVLYEYNEDDIYEDEYDDTYDSNITANDNYDGFNIKPLNQKIDIKKRDIFEAESDEEEQEGEEQQLKKIDDQKNKTEDTKGNNQFQHQQRRFETGKGHRGAKNPQPYFEKKENTSHQQSQSQPRQTQLPQRQNFKNRARGSNETSEDGIAAAPKTDEEIKRDRRWKNDNKASIAHHNRKYLSMKKTGFM